MSTSSPDNTTATTAKTIVLPPGVTVQPGRSTSQVVGQGQVIQGTVYGLILANGTTSSVFVPVSVEGNIPQVQALFDQKIQALSAIPVG